MEMEEKPKVDEKAISEALRQFGRQLEPLIKECVRRGITPYAVGEKLFPDAWSRAGLFCRHLRDRGRAEMAEFVQGEMDSILATPGLDKNMMVYFEAWHRYSKLVRHCERYCDRNGISELKYVMDPEIRKIEEIVAKRKESEQSQSHEP